MKQIILAATALNLTLCLLASPAGAADVRVPAAPAASVRVVESSDLPNAVVISVRGKCEYATDGVGFSDLDPKQVLNQGAIIRTGEKSRVDIFFRRIGTTVRLQPDTEIKLEKMYRAAAGGTPVIETLLDLRKGRIFTVVRSLVEGSTLEIRNAAGRSVVEGAPAGTLGRYIITADGTHVSDKASTRPLKLIREKGITVIAPGQQFDAKEGKMLSTLPSDVVVSMIEFDELSALAEAGESPVKPNKIGPGK